MNASAGRRNRFSNGRVRRAAADTRCIAEPAWAEFITAQRGTADMRRYPKAQVFRWSGTQGASITALRRAAERLSDPQLNQT